MNRSKCQTSFVNPELRSPSSLCVNRPAHTRSDVSFVYQCDGPSVELTSTPVIVLLYAHAHTNHAPGQFVIRDSSNKRDVFKSSGVYVGRSFTPLSGYACVGYDVHSFNTSSAPPSWQTDYSLKGNFTAVCRRVYGHEKKTMTKYNDCFSAHAHTLRRARGSLVCGLCTGGSLW